MLAEALINNRTAAMALSLRAGATANVITLTASPRLGHAERDTTLNRALTGLIEKLGCQSLVASIEAPPGAARMLTGRLNRHRQLMDIMIPGQGPAARAMFVANRLRQGLRR